MKKDIVDQIVKVVGGCCNGCRLALSVGNYSFKSPAEACVSLRRKGLQGFLKSKQYILTKKGRDFQVQNVNAARETGKLHYHTLVVMNRQEFMEYCDVARAVSLSMGAFVL